MIVADADAEQVMERLLHRTKALEIRRVVFTVDRFVKRDSGCYRESHEYLRPFIRQFDHALILFDRHGSGAESRTRLQLEQDVEEKLSRNGWANRSAAVVFDPEVEIWVWSDSPEVDQILDWTGRQPDLRTWLREKGFWGEDATKPRDPKQAMLDALRDVRRRRSPGIYRQLAERVGIGRCTDPAFLKLKETLQRWFPPL